MTEGANAETLAVGAMAVGTICGSKVVIRGRIAAAFVMLGADVVAVANDNPGSVPM